MSFKNVPVCLLVLVRMYLYSAFSNVFVLVLIHHHCTCTHDNVLGPSARLQDKRLTTTGTMKIKDGFFFLQDENFS